MSTVRFSKKVRNEIDRLFAKGAKPGAVAAALGLEASYVRSRKQAWANRRSRRAALPSLDVSPEVVQLIAKEKTR